MIWGMKKEPSTVDSRSTESNTYAQYRIVKNGHGKFRVQTREFDVDIGYYYHSLQAKDWPTVMARFVNIQDVVEFDSLEEARKHLDDYIASRTWEEVERRGDERVDRSL